MRKSFAQLLAQSQDLYARTRDMDRGHAELEIVKELTELYSEAHAEMLDEVEKALVSKK